MAAITSANVAQAIVKLVAAEALPALVGNLIMGNLVNRNYEPVLGQAGDTVNVPIAPTLVANNIAEGGTVTTQNPSLGNAQIVLNTHVEATFLIPDVTKSLAVPDLLLTYMQPAVVAIGEKIERTPGTPLTEAVIDAAETALFTAKVPSSQQKYLVVSAEAYSALRQIARFSEWNTAGEAGVNALIQGTVGKVKDFYIFRSQYVAQTGSNPVTTHNLGFARDAIGLVIRRLPQPLPGTGAIAEYAELGNFGMRVVMSYQPSTLAQQFTVDVLYGTAALRNNFGVQMNS
ncbi:MAG: hypothetical protein HY236_04790 [Acidobacteria bacterium]|nr:hypothetical protein [Acidobacteriota bacterium]